MGHKGKYDTSLSKSQGKLIILQTAFFAAGMNTLALIWIFFRLPEPSGLSYAEIDKLFEERVGARSFQKHKVIAVEAEDVGVVEVKHP